MSWDWHKFSRKEKIIRICVAISILVFFSWGVYLFFKAQYRFKWLSVEILVIYIIISALLDFVGKFVTENSKMYNIYDMLMTTASGAMICFCFIYVVGTLHLKTLSDDFKTTRASVLSYSTKNSTASFLLSDGRKTIDMGILGVSMPKNEPIQQGDCLTVQYRENWLVIEIQMKENHGKRDKKACFVY